MSRSRSKSKSTVANSREWLLSQLSNLSLDQRPKILQDLFDKNDRVCKEEYALSATYDEKMNGTGFQEHLVNWTVNTIEVLFHLKEDVLLLDKIEDWDEGILEDAFKLLTFQMRFLSDLRELKQGCKDLKFSTTYFLPIGTVQSSEELADALKTYQKELSLAIHNAMRRLKRKGTAYATRITSATAANDEGTISAATLRELIIRNQFSNRSNINWGRGHWTPNERMDKIKALVRNVKDLASK
jgi:hypothetical protein